MRLSHLFVAFAGMALAPTCAAGPLAYAVCQTGCNTIAVACYAAAGVQFGTVVAAAGAPATVIGCNVALGTCMTACAGTALIAPIP
ncbi:hypothetical protein DL96DRAFT_1616319 [Flagelloscypha sp. PMI_526]|nr:hypothetical protein DL96DRAFT_1616319 [Flagelloscypha sp. PMI_526]